MSFSLAQWQALAPFLLLSITIVVLMLAIAFRRQHGGNQWVAVVGLNLTLLSCLPLLKAPAESLTPLLVVDGYAAFYMLLVLVGTLFTCTLSRAYLDDFRGQREEMYLLLLLSALGALVLVSSQHMAALFIGLELLSVPLYGMIAYPVKNRHSLEAGLKYLVLSAAASTFLLFGMALVYAMTGSLSFAAIGTWLQGNPEPAVLYTGAALVLVGLGFKLSLVPFHLWTPDVYQGAPAPVSAYLASVAKIAVFAVLLRLVVEAGLYRQPVVITLLSLIAVASILAGNLLALRQNNVKRLLAYSSIAHFGYCLVALIAAGPLAVEAVGAYLLTYIVTTLGAFGVVALLSSSANERDTELIYDYRGLFWRRPYLAAIMTSMLLSLAGIPLTAGFIGKFYVIAAGVETQAWILVAAVVVGSAIGVYYYLRLLVTLFLRDAQTRRYDVALDWAERLGGVSVWGLMILMMLMGTFPQPFITLIQMASLPLP